MKKLFVFLMIFAAGILLTACEPKGETSQGVTEDEIVVGNTAATSGVFAGVGVPFNDAMKAVFEKINKEGGIGGRKIKFITYDDKFSASDGYTFTEKLVEEDKVFALVGHFGTPTVGATVDYIQEIGIPMVYAATGINSLYFQKTIGNPIMAVQPIYRTEGRTLVARIFNENLFGAAGNQAFGATDKIGVIYTNDDAGNSIRIGVEQEARFVNKFDSFVFQQVDATASNAASAITKLQEADVKAVILAMNQSPFATTNAAMADKGLNVPVFTSYVNADVRYVDHNISSVDRPIYANAWVDVFSDKGKEGATDFAATIEASSFTDAQKADYKTNSFAIAGYVAAMVFIEGLKRVEANKQTLNWENYIAAMEEGPIDIPMGGAVDFSEGKRWGIDALSLLKFNFTMVDGTAVKTFDKVLDIETVDQIRAK